jgi:hypothetical protein
MSDQRRIRAEQDSRLPKSSAWSWFNPDLVLLLRAQANGAPSPFSGPSLASQQGQLQFLLNGLVSEGSPRRAINVDLGLEYAGEQLAPKERNLAEAPVISDQFVRQSGSLLLRPFGRSSQDTMLLGRVGWTRIRSLVEVSGVGPGAIEGQGLSWGAEARLYILPVAGLHVDWSQTAPIQIEAWQAKAQLSSTRAGVFFEIGFLQIGANWVEHVWSRESGPNGAALSERRVAFEGELGFYF